MDFELQPVLEGELLTLRPLREADFDALYAVASDPLVWEQHPARDRWREEVFRAFFGEAMASGGALAVIDRAEGRAIGSSRFHGWDAQAREVEIGWTFLARSHWGGRYNGEMKSLMLAHAFRFADGALVRDRPGKYAVATGGGEDRRRPRRPPPRRHRPRQRRLPHRGAAAR